MADKKNNYPIVLSDGLRKQLVNVGPIVVDDLTCEVDMDEQQKTALKDWFQDVSHGHRTPLVPDQDDLDDLIVEREWFDQGFPQRVAALVQEHRRKHGKDPQRVFLPGKFANWIHKHWGERLTFEIPPKRIYEQISAHLFPKPTSPEPAEVVIDTICLKVDCIVSGNPGGSPEEIRLDTVLESSEAWIRCGHCRGEFPLLVVENRTRTQCPHCGRLLLAEWNKFTGEIVIHPVTETDKP